MFTSFSRLYHRNTLYYVYFKGNKNLNICVGNYKKEKPLSFYELVDSLLNGVHIYILYICVTI